MQTPPIQPRSADPAQKRRGGRPHAQVARGQDRLSRAVRESPPSTRQERREGREERGQQCLSSQAP